MNEELLSVLSKVVTTQLALESLRSEDTARALELLEVDLDASVIALARLSKEIAPADRERVTTALQQIRAYRCAHPRRPEADLSSMGSSLFARAAHQGAQRAHELLEEIGE